MVTAPARWTSNCHVGASDRGGAGIPLSGYRGVDLIARAACGAAAVALAIGTAVYVLAVSAQSLDTRTTRDGIFSARQVAAGREAFEWECTECHEIAEFTGAGGYFEEVDGERLWDTFDFIWTEMPEDRPSWLDPEEYAEILAYLLSVYGMPSGDRDMPIDQATLEQIVIANPELPGS